MQKVIAFQTGVKSAGSIVSRWLWTGHLPPFLLRFSIIQKLLELSSQISHPSSLAIRPCFCHQSGLPCQHS